MAIQFEDLESIKQIYKEQEEEENRQKKELAELKKEEQRQKNKIQALKIEELERKRNQTEKEQKSGVFGCAEIFALAVLLLAVFANVLILFLIK